MKIKDTIKDNKLFSDKELGANEPGYKYIDEKGEHLHKLDGKPLFGTSTILSVLNKPLAYWASGLACEKFGWINKKDEDGKLRTKEERLQPVVEFLQRTDKFSAEEWLALTDEAYSAHATSLKKSATGGTDLHAELEKFVKNWLICHDPKNKGGDMIDSTKYDNRILPFITWAQENVKRFLWSEMNCYSEKYWLGGISDCGFEDKEGKYGSIDFKSAKVAYDSHFIQIAGYDLEISENGGFDKNGVKTFTLDKPIEYYIVFPFGMKNMTPQFRHNVKEL